MAKKTVAFRVPDGLLEINKAAEECSGMSQTDIAVRGLTMTLHERIRTNPELRDKVVTIAQRHLDAAIAELGEVFTPEIVAGLNFPKPEEPGQLTQ